MFRLNFYNDIPDNKDDIHVNENCNGSPRREILTWIVLIFILC